MYVLSWSTPLLLIVFIFEASCRFEFTNIKCTPLDKDFMGFEACLLKSVNRTYKYLTIRTKIHQLPLEDIGVRVEVLKKVNGYKPWLFNFTTEICQFFRGKGTPVVRFFYGLFAPYTNLNHSCPYNHDIIVEKLPISFLNHQLTAVLPVPEGEYCAHSVYSVRGKPRMDLKV